MVKMVSAPMISYRLISKIFLCVIIVAITGVVTGESTLNDYEHEVELAVKTATKALQHEIDSLQGQIDLFEMKHETLQAASEHFRVQSRSLKSKLDDERSRYESLESEKRSLEASIESKIASALQGQKARFEDTIAAEHTDQQKLRTKEIQELGEKLRRCEYNFSMLEEQMKEKMVVESKRYELLLGKKKISEEKLSTEINDLTERLSFSEKQAKSFEESLKRAILEVEEKDDFLQKESENRMEEADRWEKRMKKQIAESQKLYKEKQSKEEEFIESEKLRKSLLEKVQTSEGAIKKMERKVRALTTENKELQDELVDGSFELESSRKKTKQLIEENSEMTKAYNAALEKLSTKNSLLQNELVEMKFESEESHTETELLKKRIKEEIVKKEKMQEELLLVEFQLDKNKELEDRLNNKNKELQQMYNQIEERLEEREMKMLDYKQQQQSSLNYAEKLEGTIQDLERKVEDLTEQLESRLNHQINATESRSTELSRMYESMKEKNDALSRDLYTANEKLINVQSSHQNQVDSFSQNLKFVSLQLEEKNKALKECDNELRDTQAKYPEIIQDNAAEKKGPVEKEQKLKVEEPVADELKTEAEFEENQSAEQDIDETEIKIEQKPLLNKKTAVVDETSAKEEDATSDSETSSGFDMIFTVFRWLDYSLYKILRVIVDSALFLANILWKISSHFDTGRLAGPFKPFFELISWALNEFRIIHYALVSLFEFEMTFVSSLVSREKDRTGFAFLINHSEMMVMLGEAIAALLCVDFVFSSIKNQQRVRRQRRPQTIPVPKMATTSLLRKANM